MQEVPDQSTRVFSPRSPLPLLFLPPVPTSSTPFSHLLSFSFFLMSFSFLFSRWYWTLATPFTIYYLSKYDSRKFAIGFLCNGQKGSPPCGPSGLSSKMAFSCNRPFLHKAGLIPTHVPNVAFPTRGLLHRPYAVLAVGGLRYAWRSRSSGTERTK